MSIFAYLDGSLLPTARIRLKANGDMGIGGLSADANGEMAQGAITFEDTGSDLTVTGWMAVAVNEPDCTSAPRLFTGYVADYTYQHGSHYRLTPERDIDVTINDTNVLLAVPLFQAADSPNRPAETDAARVAWLLNTAAMTGKIHDLGFVQTDTIDMDATDYTNASPADVLNDVCGPRNYVFFTYWDQSARKIGLFVAPPDAALFTSTLSFSNDPADITITAGEPSGTCFPAYLDPTMTADPSTVYCTVIYKCVGFTVEGHSQTTHDAFFASDDTGNKVPAVDHRSIMLESSRTGKVATAHTALANLLIFYGSDRRTVTFTTRLPAAQVGLLQAGMLTNLKFRHLPGLTAFTAWRVQTLTVAPTEGDPTHYDLEVTASLSGLAIPGGSGGGTTTPFPPGPPGTAVHFYSGTFPVIGDETFVANSDLGLLSGLQTRASTTTTLTSDAVYNYDVTVAWEASSYGHDVSLKNDNLASPFSVPLSFGSTDMPDGPGSYHFTGSFTAPDLAHNQSPYRMGGFAAQTPHGHTQQGTVTFWIDPVGWDDQTSVTVPTSGQPWGPELPNETPDGATTVFTMTDGFTFVPNSLRVYVDRLDQTAAVTSYDGTASPPTFTLAFAPKTGELVEVYGTAN